MSDDLDLLDQQLRADLGGVAPRRGDPDATLDALTPRFRRARRRHRTVLATSVAAVVAAVVVGIIGLLGPADGPGRDVRVPPADSSEQPRPSPTVSTQAPTTSTPEPTTSTTPAGDGPQAATPPAPNGVTGATGITGGPPATDATAPPTTPPAPVEHTYSSAGGSVTVRLADGALSIVSTAPAPGYTEERHDTGPDRVEVRFDNLDGEWRIRVDLVNGQPVEETTHH